MGLRRRIKTNLGNRIERWVTRRLKRQTAPVTITRQHGLYILPTRYGYICSLMLFGMLMVAMNYNNSMVFLLTFLLSGMTFISMTHVHRNLLGLEFHAGTPADVFVGETAWFPVRVENISQRTRHALMLNWKIGQSKPATVPAGDATTIQVPVTAAQRGNLQVPRLSPFTNFPFGLFRAWAWIHPAMDCVVYPQPAEAGAPLPEGYSGNLQRQRGVGEDEFSGLREYQPGDPPKRVAWKVAARGQGLATKQFESGGERAIVLDYAALGQRNAEQRLSQLCRWVLDCEAQGLRYALHLPGQQINSGLGPAHQRECLRALALFDRA